MSFLRFPTVTGLLVVAAGFGCGNPTSSSSELNQLAVARERWAARGPAAYLITLFRSCECLPEMSGPVTIEVRDGHIETLSYTTNGQTPDPRYAGGFKTVEGLFELIESAIAEEAASVVVIYHPLFGFPERIALDYHPVHADDEVGYRPTDFQPR